MTKFFVGQRVRCVYSASGAIPIGTEGHIHKIEETQMDNGGIAECLVVYPGFPSWFWDAGSWGCRFGWIEPILPEGSAPSQYSFSDLMDSLRETVK